MRCRSFSSGWTILPGFPRSTAMMSSSSWNLSKLTSPIMFSNILRRRWAKMTGLKAVRLLCWDCPPRLQSARSTSLVKARNVTPPSCSDSPRASAGAGGPFLHSWIVAFRTSSGTSTFSSDSACSSSVGVSEPRMLLSTKTKQLCSSRICSGDRSDTERRLLRFWIHACEPGMLRMHLGYALGPPSPPRVNRRSTMPPCVLWPGWRASSASRSNSVFKWRRDIEFLEMAPGVGAHSTVPWPASCKATTPLRRLMSSCKSACSTSTLEHLARRRRRLADFIIQVY
mmetsp:Transcript_40169/g.76783  ORF Transcript_40169/g.76783 Transcript_40169/m.76783 type:complete len:284 (+) Transcript_40169:1561-2412(+)